MKDYILTLRFKATDKYIVEYFKECCENIGGDGAPDQRFEIKSVTVAEEK